MRRAWLAIAALAAGCGSGGASPPVAAAVAPAPVPVPVDAAPALVADPCGAFAAAWTSRFMFTAGEAGVVEAIDPDRLESMLRGECEAWPSEAQQCAGREPRRAFEAKCADADSRKRINVRVNTMRDDPPDLDQAIAAAGPGCGYDAVLVRAEACAAIAEEHRAALRRRWTESAVNPANAGGQTAIGITACKRATERLRIRLARVGC